MDSPIFSLYIAAMLHASALLTKARAIANNKFGFFADELHKQHPPSFPLRIGSA